MRCEEKGARAETEAEAETMRKPPEAEKKAEAEGGRSQNARRRMRSKPVKQGHDRSLVFIYQSVAGKK